MKFLLLREAWLDFTNWNLMDKDQLIERTKKYVDKKNEKKFIPNESYITASGQYFDSDDVASLHGS